tara:strand:+ start:265 stop:372 length:108 start_codon:yes stop_codon:yes gene_type:complete
MKIKFAAVAALIIQILMMSQIMNQKMINQWIDSKT